MSDTKTKTIVALYGRVSTEQQVQHGDSLAAQRDTLTHWAQSMSWEVFDLYIDQGITGGISERPELQRLMKDARAGRFNLVAVLKLDRFYREQRLLANCIHEFDELHIGFISQSESIDTRIPGMTRVYLAMMGSMAQYERECIAERQIKARAFHKSLAQWSSGRTLFGYHYNKATKTLEIVESEAEAVRFIFTKYTTQKIGLAKLAIELNKTTLPPPRVRKHQQRDFWTQGGILHILKHPAYKGGPSAEWAYATPAIITPELWQQAQDRRNNNFHFRPSDQGKTKYQGRLVCGLCGRRLSIGYNGGHHRVYTCPGRAHLAHADGSPKCTLPRFDTDTMDKQIANKIEKLCKDPSLLFDYLTQYTKNVEKEQVALKAQLKPLQKEADAVREDMNIIDAKLELKRISVEDYKSRMATLKSKLTGIESRTSNLDPMLVREIERNTTWLDASKSFLEGWPKIVGDTRVSSWDLAQHVRIAADLPRWHEAVKESFKVLKGETTIEKADPVLKMVGDAFQLFVIYPDKIEFKGNISVANLQNSTAYC
jgi:site-specific DNA recombinase